MMQVECQLQSACRKVTRLFLGAYIRSQAPFSTRTEKDGQFAHWFSHYVQIKRISH